jgi:NAD(P)-dependent dehydrogenase (short-subunit alcohol dehydrogenase family)
VQPQGESVAQSSLPVSTGPWLILADSGGVGDAVAARLQAQGDASVLVTRGPSYERADAAHFRINPEQPEDLRRCLAAALLSGQTIYRGIIHLWSLDAGLPEDTDLASTEQSPEAGML